MMIAREEERRLLYVAMTRAKDTVHLVLPQRRFTHSQCGQGDRHVYASRTRFIPREILEHFDYVNWPGAAQGCDGAGPRTKLRVDVAAQMLGMW